MRRFAASISSASRYVDARLTNYATFSDITATPPTPAVVEKIARLIAAIFNISPPRRRKPHVT